MLYIYIYIKLIYGFNLFIYRINTFTVYTVYIGGSEGVYNIYIYDPYDCTNPSLILLRL